MEMPRFKEDHNLERRESSSGGSNLVVSRLSGEGAVWDRSSVCEEGVTLFVMRLPLKGGRVCDVGASSMTSGKCGGELKEGEVLLNEESRAVKVLVSNGEREKSEKRKANKNPQNQHGVSGLATAHQHDCLRTRRQHGRLSWQDR
jgi:hypothetical protein